MIIKWNSRSSHLMTMPHKFSYDALNELCIVDTNNMSLLIMNMFFSRHRHHYCLFLFVTSREIYIYSILRAPQVWSFEMQANHRCIKRLWQIELVSKESVWVGYWWKSQLSVNLNLNRILFEGDAIMRLASQFRVS